MRTLDLGISLSVSAGGHLVVLKVPPRRISLNSSTTRKKVPFSHHILLLFASRAVINFFFNVIWKAITTVNGKHMCITLVLSYFGGQIWVFVVKQCLFIFK